MVTGAHPCSCAVSVMMTEAWAHLWERALASLFGFPRPCHRILSWLDKERVLATALRIALFDAFCVLRVDARRPNCSYAMRQSYYIEFLAHHANRLCKHGFDLQRAPLPNTPMPMLALDLLHRACCVRKPKRCMVHHQHEVAPRAHHCHVAVLFNPIASGRQATLSCSLNPSKNTS